MSEAPQMVDVYEQGAHDTFLSDVLEGLSQSRKTLPCKYFYDKRGSELFDRICELDEYYPTRTELAIMRQYGREMGAAVGSGVLAIELGSGNNVKIRLLLDALESPAGYVPIDISREHLAQAAHDLKQDFPALPIHPVWADYHAPLNLPDDVRDLMHRLVYFPGSTIGNFLPGDAVKFLERIARLAGPDGWLLIGVDCKKDPAILERAYNDAEGITAAFNKNVLVRINNELGGNFPLDRFRHRALWNPEEGRIEMHLESQDDCVVAVEDAQFSFRRGETICTEFSYKYTPEEFASLAERAGFQAKNVWTDENALFSVQLMHVIGRPTC